MKRYVELGFFDGLKYKTELFDEYLNKDGINRLYYKIYERQEGKTPFTYNVDVLTQYSIRNSVPIAYVPMMGAIMEGKSKTKSWFDNVGVGSDTICGWLREIEKKGHIRCVILHVDSPGGLVSASGTILNQIRQLKKKGIKFVTLMSNVGASGGYHVSCGSDKIIANSLTITGSIGVIIAKLINEKFYSQLGISNDRITMSEKNSTMSSSLRHWSEDDQKKINGLMDICY
eukprot:UN34096